MRLSRKGLPESVRKGLNLQRGERVLAHAATRDGSLVVATTIALHLLAAHRRLPWERVEQASWREGWLHVREADREHHLRLTDPGSVPETVNERVTATVVVSHHARLPGGGGVRIVGRRAPRDDGEPRWMFMFDSDLDPADPRLRDQAERLLEDLRRQTGL